MEQTNPQPNPLANSSLLNKPTLIVSIILFFVVLSSLVTYLLVKSQIPSQTPVNSPTPTPSISPTPPVADETINWKTYTNTILGIEFKYPIGWYYMGAGNNTLFPIALSEVEIKEFPPDSPAGPIYFYINECTKLDTKEKYPCQKTSQDYLEMIKESFTSESLKINSNFILSGRTATQLSGILKPSPAGENPYSKITILPLDKYSFSISLVGKKLDNIYDQILSTFKFLE